MIQKNNTIIYCFPTREEVLTMGTENHENDGR
jgi:hypothetical protein